MTKNEFRKELNKRLPGFKWTVHVKSACHELHATGTRSAGFNRLSTIEVYRKRGCSLFIARSSGYGTKSPWVGDAFGTSVANCLTALRDYYRAKEANYSALAGAIDAGRREP